MDNTITLLLSTCFILVNIILDKGCIAYVVTTLSTIDSRTAIVGATVKFNCTFVVDQNIDQKEEVDLTWNFQKGESIDNVVSTKCVDSLSTDLADTRGRHKSTYIVSEDGTYQCSLIITDISQNDGGSYGCTLTLTGNGTVSDQGTVLGSTNLTELSVVQCLSSPVDQVNVMTIREGVLFDFICNVSGSARNVIWLDSDNNNISHPGIGQIQRRLRPRDNGEMFTCEVTPVELSSSRDDETVTCSISPLRIFPIATMMETAIVMEGASVAISCTGNGAQNVTKYSWFYNNMPILVDDTQFIISTAPDFRDSVLNVTKAIVMLNNTYFTCKVHTEDGLNSTNSTQLIVMAVENGVPSDSPAPNERRRWPIAVGATLAVAVLLVAGVFSVNFKRHKKQPTDTEKNVNKDSPKTEKKANGYTKNTQNRQSQISIDDRRPSLDFLDESSGRRRSSLFRESFMDLWKGNNMDDNISDTSSVSLPSFAAVTAVSRSRPDLVTADPDDEFAYTPTRAHAPLAARMSAPASLHFKTRNEREDNAAGNIHGEEIIERDDDDMKVEGYDDIHDENDAVPEMTEPRKIEQSNNNKKDSIASYTSNVSIPSVVISLPDDD